MMRTSQLCRDECVLPPLVVALGSLPTESEPLVGNEASTATGHIMTFTPRSS